MLTFSETKTKVYMKKSLFRLTDLLELCLAYSFCFSLNLLMDYAKTLDLDAYILKAFLKNFIDYQPLIVSLFTFIVIAFHYQMLERKKAEIFCRFQGYQETKYVNQEGVYIANLDPDSHIDMGIVGENGIQAVYDYKRDSNGVLTGRPGTVYDVNIKYTAPNGEKKTYSKKGFPTKKEATQHEAEMKAKLHNPGQIASIASQRKQTVASYLNEWVESYARVNLRPSTYDGYKKTIANYINPYIGGVALNQLTPAMVDKMFQQIIDKGLKPSTAAGAKRVLSVALSHARKYRYIETNAAKDTLTKFGKSDKTPDPYTPEQVKALMQRVEGTVWEMPVILGGLYGMRRSEILGLRWRNVDLENNTFDVSEQLPFKVPPKTKVIEEMAPPKSNGRKLPITELARPFFLKQFAMQEAQREQAEKDGKPYYDNDLVVAKPDGSPISASWVSSQFGKLLEDLNMPHIRFHDLRHTAATNMHQLTGDFYTVGEVLGHTLAGIGVSLGLSMNFEAVTARYVDVRLERKKEVLDAYHGAVKQADPAKAEKAEPKKAKSAAKKKSSDLEL